MNVIISFTLSFFLTLINQFNLSLETAFLRNDPGKLHQLLPLNSPVLITLPEPFQVSDCLSDEQAFLLMKRLFAETTTMEFFIDQENPPVLGERGAICQARWSFVDQADGRKYLFRVYFYLFPEELVKDSQKTGFKIKIKEIRAEKR
ncbi:MAG: hypothetical protein ACPLRA_00320 [Candidatus Saccharicenans sp.]